MTNLSRTNREKKRVSGNGPPGRPSTPDKLAEAAKILLRGGQIRRESASVFHVRSQSKPETWYSIEWTGKRWRCSCANRKGRGGCKHIDCLVLFQSLPQILMQNLDPDSLNCPNCSSPFENVIRMGIQRNKSGMVQRYQCNQCGHRFNNRDGFGRLKSNPALIVVATDLCLRGLSAREIERHLREVYGCAVDHVTVYRWTTRYLNMLARIERKLVATRQIHVGDKWHVDEAVIKVGGRKAYVWSLLDYRTRYLLASHVSRSRGSNIAEKVIRKAIRRFGKTPKKLVSDGLTSYKSSIKKLNDMNGCGNEEIGPVRHIAGKTFQDKVNNNVIERYNRTLRKRVRVAEKFEQIESANSFVAGFGAFYNLLRPNIGLSNETPSNRARLAKEQSLVRLLRCTPRNNKEYSGCTIRA